MRLFFFYGKSLPSAAKLFPIFYLPSLQILSVFVIAEGVKKTKQMNTGEVIGRVSVGMRFRFPLLLHLAFRLFTIFSSAMLDISLRTPIL